MNEMLKTPLVKKAHDFASLAHFGQKRLSGEPYIIHPLAVATILADWKMDISSIIAGFLHDTVEQGAATLDDIEKDFGITIRNIVDSVTIVGAVKLRGSDDEEFVENLRKMFVASAKDLRVVVVKLADRLHNMRTLQFQTESKQRQFAKETISIYAPLADRLGMGEVKGELEDLSFPYLYPQDYKWLVKYSASAYKEAEKHIGQIKKKLLAILIKEGIKVEVHGRKKHLYSLYKKLLREEINKDISLIFDLVALRIIVNSISECYQVLGVVHKFFRPVRVAGGVSDYIALPRPNGYKSIHTKVFGPDGRIIEIQIRTYEMHDEAENGIAAHWHYSGIKNNVTSDKKLETNVFAPSDRLSWVKQLANWQKDVTDSEEFMQNLKFDALSHRIFVFTPNGDVKDLPTGATPIDFAYAVHTKLGDRTIGAKVNGKMVSFEYKLNSGDVCEIILAKEARKPNLDWLEFVVTNLAKKEIHKGWRAPI